MKERGEKESQEVGAEVGASPGNRELYPVCDEKEVS